MNAAIKNVVDKAAARQKAINGQKHEVVNKGMQKIKKMKNKVLLHIRRCLTRQPNIHSGEPGK